MKRSQFIMFFSVALSLYGVFNFYVWLRAWEALAAVPAVRPWFTTAFVAVAASWIVGRVLEGRDADRLGAALVYGGSFWLAAMIWSDLLALCIDIIRLADRFGGFLPYSLTERGGMGPLWVLCGAALLIIGAVVAGHVNAVRPRVKKLEFDIPKSVPGKDSITLAVASDIHLGTIICRSRLEKIVEVINNLNADIVLLPGDVIDEDLKPVIRQNLGELLRGIRSKHGVYAITGNHEYIGGVEPAVEYLVEHGLIELRDSVANVAGVYIIGREDISIQGFTGKKRKPLEELLAGVDKTAPLIMMDHQPYRLEDAVQSGIDVQFSGHTHHGQIWPFGYITKAIYEVSWGYRKKGNTHIYVSCGVGSWGPPVRLGNTPEVIFCTLRFRGN